MGKKASRPKIEDATPPEAEPANTHGRNTPASKSDAIRMAIAAGFDSPQAGAAYVKSEFGLDVTPQHFSATKGRMKSLDGVAKGKPGGKPKAVDPAPAGPSQVIDGYLAPPPDNKSLDGRRELLAAMEAMKPLIASLGKEEAHRIVDLLG